MTELLISPKYRFLLKQNKTKYVCRRHYNCFSFVIKWDFKSRRIWSLFIYRSKVYGKLSMNIMVRYEWSEFNSRWSRNNESYQTQLFVNYVFITDYHWRSNINRWQSDKNRWYFSYNNERQFSLLESIRRWLQTKAVQWL